MSIENGQHYNYGAIQSRQMVLARRRVFVSAYLANGGDPAGALAEAGFPFKDKTSASRRATMLFKTPQVQEMLKAQSLSRGGIEQDRIHDEIKKLVREARSRYESARDRELDADPDRALKWEEQTNNRFKLLLAATELMLESATKHLKFRMNRLGEKQGEDKVVNLTQNVVIVDRKSEEAKKTHEGAHEALDITPVRVVDAG